MDDKLEIVPDNELMAAFGNANFGGMTPREVLDFAVLKCASGYYQGHTSTQLCEKLGLITPSYELTHKGKAYLWAAFKGNTTL